MYYGHAAENIGLAEAVVCNSAIAADNPELLEAKRRGIPVYSRAELLHLISMQYENVIGVAGCHGKTTAAAMCAHVLEEGRAVARRT